MSFRRVRSISRLATRVCTTMSLVMALLLRAFDIGEQVFTADGDGGNSAFATAAHFGQSDNSSSRAGCCLVSERSGECTWSTPESEGAYWRTLTSPSQPGMTIIMKRKPEEVGRVVVPECLRAYVLRMFHNSQGCAPEEESYSKADY